MKKMAGVVLYCALSLISIFISLKIIGYLNIQEFFRDKVRNGCWELDKCEFSAWYYLTLSVEFMLPMVVFVIVGYKASDNAFSVRTGINAVKLFIATFIYYMACSVSFQWFITR